MEFMGRKVDVLDTEELKLVPEQDREKQLTFTSPADWTPDQAEQYIDWRIQLVDAEITRLREQLEEQTATRKRWLSVTGGRSKITGNGNGGNGEASGGE
jgi:hypothetical protein